MDNSQIGWDRENLTWVSSIAFIRTYETDKVSETMFCITENQRNGADTPISVEAAC